MVKWCGQRVEAPGHVTTEAPVMSPKLTPIDFKAVAAKGWYVYCYLRHKDSKTAKAFSPYYIGIGSSRIRARWGPHGKTPIPANHALIRVIRSGLTKDTAGEWEKFYINYYGRKMDGGILVNQRLGGSTGGYGWKASVDTKAKMSAAHKGMKFSAEHRARLSKAAAGKDMTLSIHNPESQAKAALSRTGRIVADSTCEAISLGKAERKAAVVGLTATEWMALGDEKARVAYFSRYQAGFRDAALLCCDSTIRIDVIKKAHEIGIDPFAYNQLNRQEKANLNRRYKGWQKWADTFNLTFNVWEALGKSGQMKLIKTAA